MTDPIAAEPEFFQPGHTYAREHHAATIRFLVRYIDDSPEGIPYRVAFGWRTEDGDVCASPFDSDDFDGWTDVTTEPAAVQPPADRAAAIAAAIGPTMLLGLQDAELFDGPGRERIQDWIKWISETVAALPAPVQPPADRAAHACDNCSGIDPDTCLFNPDRPRDAATAVVSSPPSRLATLTDTERDVLCSALDLAEEEMLARGDDEDQLEALKALRRLAVEAQQDGAQPTIPAP